MDSVTSPSMAQVSNTNTSVFSPLLISILGVVVTATAIMAYHLILVKYCLHRNAAEAEQPATGVDEKVLQTIPILVFSIVKRSIQQRECVVCLGELEDEDKIRLLPNCNHAFHVSCIDQWFVDHDSCPMCRSPLQQQPTMNSEPESSDPIRGGSSENRAPPSLRRSASLAAEAMERRSCSRLKRSASMEAQSVVVVIDGDRDDCGSATSFSSSMGRGILRRSGSLSHFDRVPSKWLRSLSWLRTGKPSNAASLPC